MRWITIVTLCLALVASIASAQEIEITAPPAASREPTPRWRIHGATPLLEWTDSTGRSSTARYGISVDRSSARATGMASPELRLGLGYLWTQWLVTGVTLEAGYDRATVADGGSFTTIRQSMYGMSLYVGMLARIQGVRPFFTAALVQRWATLDLISSGLPPEPSIQLNQHTLELAVGASVFLTDALSIDVSLVGSRYSSGVCIGATGWL